MLSNENTVTITVPLNVIQLSTQFLCLNVMFNSIIVRYRIKTIQFPNMIV